MAPRVGLSKHHPAFFPAVPAFGRWLLDEAFPRSMQVFVMLASLGPEVYLYMCTELDTFSVFFGQGVMC